MDQHSASLSAIPDEMTTLLEMVEEVALWHVGNLDKLPPLGQLHLSLSPLPSPSLSSSTRSCCFTAIFFLLLFCLFWFVDLELLINYYRCTKN